MGGGVGRRESREEGEWEGGGWKRRERKEESKWGVGSVGREGE